MDKILYSEDQRFPQWMTFLLIIITSIVPVWAFIQQILLKIPYGENPMSDTGVFLLLLMPLFFGVLFFSFKLEIRISKDEIMYKMKPFNRNFKSIKKEEISSIEIVPAKIPRRYGGWGVKFGTQGRSYFLRGKHGLKIERKKGINLIFSITKPVELKMVLSKIKAMDEE